MYAIYNTRTASEQAYHITSGERNITSCLLFYKKKVFEELKNLLISSVPNNRMQIHSGVIFESFGNTLRKFHQPGKYCSPETSVWHRSFPNDLRVPEYSDTFGLKRNWRLFYISPHLRMGSFVVCDRAELHSAHRFVRAPWIYIAINRIRFSTTFRLSYEI